MASGLIAGAPRRQYGEVKVFGDFSDVVFAGQHAMVVAMDHEPAIALRVGARAIKFSGRFGQLVDQLRPWAVPRRSLVLAGGPGLAAAG